MSRVSWSRGVTDFLVSYFSWCQWFPGVIGFAVLMVLWFYKFRGVMGFMVSWCQCKMGFTGLHDSPSRV